MYEKIAPSRAGLTPKFEDGVATFIKWAKSKHPYMDGEKIKCPCQKCKNEVFKILDEVNFDLYIKSFMMDYYNWTSHGKERVQKYFEPVIVPLLQEEQIPAAPMEEGTSMHWGDTA
ncbi:UNVERIFIED_CONTAM: hypothetical protein Slati_1737600 [Sesamum latifolium]|uniref:Transposase-associated domain-containing protein n=1 Tax=Sesamum latifolium TaxID=2727402 RepID=A0AAW2WW28_9LAMI